MSFRLRVGSRTQVMNGNAAQTSGGLKKEDLAYNASGHIVSKKKQEWGLSAENRITRSKMWGRMKFGENRTPSVNVKAYGPTRKHLYKLGPKSKKNVQKV